MCCRLPPLDLDLRLLFSRLDARNVITLFMALLCEKSVSCGLWVVGCALGCVRCLLCVAGWRAGGLSGAVGGCGLWVVGYALGCVRCLLCVAGWRAGGLSGAVCGTR